MVNLPVSSAKAAFSNSGTKVPLTSSYSPPESFEPGSAEYFLASSPKSSPFLTSASTSLALARSLASTFPVGATSIRMCATLRLSCVV